ncbi:hypothetical protein EV175_004911, partial [Coemansia sp. RSA 1933]
SNPLNVMFFGVDEFDAVYLKALIEEKYKSNPAIGHINVVTISDRTQKNLYDHPVLYEAPVKILAVSGVISTRRISAMQDMHKLEFKFKEDHGFDMKFDIGIIGNFPYHISPFVKDQFRLGCYSIHNSLLPKYRGPTPVETAILNKDKATGVTISEYSPNNPDTGKILIQTPINLPELPRRTSVLYSLSNAGSFLLVDSLKNIELLREKAVTQNEQEATYTKEYQDSFCKIVWEKSTAEEIERKSRAFEGKFFVHTNWVGKKLRRRISLESVELPRKDQKPLDKKIELGRPGSLYYDNVSNYLETVCIDRTRMGPGARVLDAVRSNRRIAWLGSVSIASFSAYMYDRNFQASAVWRSLRTFKDIGIICVDYKVNFREESGAERLNEIHERAARRLLRCCQENGGLFIKFGQSIAIQSALLPPAFRKELSVLYDNAPSVPVEKIAPVVEQTFAGKRLDDLFIDFSSTAVASASVAQVHTARLRSDPTQRVAVKVQKPEIRLQIGWDLFALRTCARLVEYAFEVPMLWSVAEVERRLREELDFEREGNNSELAEKDLHKLGDRWLRRSIYIPQVFWHATGKRVLTTEWVDGTSLVHPTKLLDEGWSGKDIMQKMVSLFAFQIFVSGNVHGDPHPGNILIRQNPDNNSYREPQLVVLDHGLYVRESHAFRRQYTEFWRAAMLGEKRTMARVARSWGMPDADMFSTMVSLKPPKLRGRRHGSRKDRSETELASERSAAYERNMELKGRAIAALRDSHRLPPELVFVTRNMNIVRANNQSLGIPVDRVQILGQYAALGLRNVLTDEALSPSRRFSYVHGVDSRRDTMLSRLGGILVGQWSYITFRVVLAAAGLGMSAYRLWCRTLALVTGKKYATDLDTIMDEAMRKVVEKRLGYQIDTSLFNA